MGPNFPLVIYKSMLFQTRVDAAYLRRGLEIPPIKSSVLVGTKGMKNNVNSATMHHFIVHINTNVETLKGKAMPFVWHSSMQM